MISWLDLMQYKEDIRSRPVVTPTGDVGACTGARSAPASLSSNSSCSSASNSALSSS